MQTRTLRPPEARKVEFDYSEFPEIVAGQNLTGTPTVAGDTTGLTIGTPTISGDSVFAMVSGGSNEAVHKLRCLCDTDAATTPTTVLVCVGKLKITHYGD